jgi:DNA-binding transcriptional LysR family regulator
MRISSLQLEAFYAVTRNKGFSGAAKSLGLSQPALSQRVLNLERDLGVRLFARDASGTRLTAAGERLLRHCQVQEALEGEVLGEIRESSVGLQGVIRIGGFSTVMKSRILPQLAGLVGESPAVTIEALTRELRDLPGLLRAGEIDFAVTDAPIEGYDFLDLAPEYYVLVKRARGPERSDVYLDHDFHDRTTLRFLGLRQAHRRSFLDDIEGILEGVRMGWGRAVVPRHLIEDRRDLSEVKGHKAMRSRVVLNWLKGPYPTKLQSAVIEALQVKTNAV